MCVTAGPQMPVLGTGSKHCPPMRLPRVHPLGIWQPSFCDACGFGYPACVEGAEAQWAGLVSGVCAWLVFSRCLLEGVQYKMLSSLWRPFFLAAPPASSCSACLPLGLCEAVLAEAPGTGSTEGLQAMSSFGRDFTT